MILREPHLHLNLKLLELGLLKFLTFIYNKCINHAVLYKNRFDQPRRVSSGVYVSSLMVKHGLLREIIIQQFLNIK